MKRNTISKIVLVIAAVAIILAIASIVIDQGKNNTPNEQKEVISKHATEKRF